VVDAPQTTVIFPATPAVAVGAPGTSGASSIAIEYVRYIQLTPPRPSLSVPDPRPATVGEVVTETVVEAPAASVAVVVPEEANCTDTIWAGSDGVRTAVALELPTLVTRKTLVKVRAEGTVPKSSESESTLPLATGVAVPAWTAPAAATEKWLESWSTPRLLEGTAVWAVNAADVKRADPAASARARQSNATNGRVMTAPERPPSARSGAAST
jgi:hypothetical protein